MHEDLKLYAKEITREWEGMRKKVGLGALKFYDEGPTRIILVYEREGELLGVCLMGFDVYHRLQKRMDKSQEVFGGKKWIEVIHLATKRKGIGEKFLVEICKIVEEQKAGIVLWARPTAISWYQRMGFVLIPSTSDTFYMTEEEVRRISLQ